FLVDAGELRLHLVADLEDRARVLDSIAAELGGAQLSFDTVAEIDDRAAGVDVLHHTLDDRALGVVGDVARERILRELLDAERYALALRVDRQHHGLDLLALLAVAHRLLAGLIPGDVRQVHEAVDVAGEPDEDAEVGDRLDLARHLIAAVVIGGELLPRVRRELLEAERYAAALLVHVEHHHLDFLAGVHHFRGVDVLVGPVHLRDVHQSLDPVLDLDEGAVVGDVGDLAEHAGVRRVAPRDVLPRIGAELLESQAHPRALAVELDDLELERLAFEIRGIAHRAHVDERPWKEGAHVLDLDGEAPLDAPGDDTGHDLGFVERLLEACPGAGALGLLARQAGLAGAVLDRIECDLHLVAGLDLDLAALVLELLEGDDGLGLEAYVDDDDVGGDIHHEPREDHSRADALIGETLLEKLRETFCHIFTLHATGVPALAHSS